MGKPTMKKILIIEDDEAFRSTLSDFLTLFDFQVIDAEDGLIGLKLATEHHPDLIICDVNMPGINGYEVLKELRSNPDTEKTPFLFLTSEADVEKRACALKLGANAYLNKSVQLNDLLMAVETQYN